MMCNHALGWVRDFEDLRDYTVDHKDVKPFLLQGLGSEDDEAAIPSRYDIEDQVDLPEIYAQGRLGSCTAQAACFMYETYLRLAHADDSESGMYLSRLFLYKVTRNILGWKGDTGAYLRTVMQALAMFGAPPEEYWPYEISKYEKEPSAFLYSMAQNYQALTYYRLDRMSHPDKTIDSIKLNLSRNRACIFGFTVYTNIGKGPDVPMPGKKTKIRGGHAVCAVGFDDTRPVKNEEPGAFRFANSWDTIWGDDGFGWLPYAYVRKHLATDWWTIHKAEWLDYSVFQGA